MKSNCYKLSKAGSTKDLSLIIQMVFDIIPRLRALENVEHFKIALRRVVAHCAKDEGVKK